MNEVDMLRNDSLVREKDLGNGISSFNFSNKCFWDKKWTTESIKARGLFCDVKNNNVVARSYNKFFNIGERPETEMRNLRTTFAYPVQAYVKYNGFLAIVSADKDNPDKLFIASKSTNEGQFAGYIKNIINSMLSEDAQKDFANTLHNLNISAVFECIDSAHDTHIVEYFSPRLVMLDCIYNSFEYKHMSYENMREFACKFGFLFKVRFSILTDWEDFTSFIDWHKDDNGIEGFVFEDANGFMVKYKTLWYRYWKQVRGVLQQVWNGRDIDSIKNINNKIKPEHKQPLLDFVASCRNRDACPSVIEFRNSLS